MQEGPWTFGCSLIISGPWPGQESRPNVSSTFLQPFHAYTTKNAWTFTLNSESTYDWNGEDRSVPLNFVVSKLLKIEGQPKFLELLRATQALFASAQTTVNGD